MTHNTREVEEVDYDLALNTLIDSLHTFHKDCLEFPYVDDPIARRARKVVYAKDIIKPFIATIQSIKQTLHHQLQKAREEERERCIKVIEDYGKSMSKLHSEMIGTAHEDSKMMLAFDMHSRLIAVKHITEKMNHSELDQDKV